MKYKDLEGNITKWHPTNSPRENASKNHLTALALVKESMPGALIFEECLLPLGLKNKNIYLDILVPDFLLAIEVDGSQHEKFNPFFHKDRSVFLRQVQNDLLKEEWCNINNIKLIRLKDNNVGKWRESIVFGASRRDTK